MLYLVNNAINERLHAQLNINCIGTPERVVQFLWQPNVFTAHW